MEACPDLLQDLEVNFFPKQWIQPNAGELVADDVCKWNAFSLLRMGNCIPPFVKQWIQPNAGELVADDVCKWNAFSLLRMGNCIPPFVNV
jgi:hypothetical protein